MAEDREIAGEDRPKVYLETSFMFYLTGMSIITPRSYLEDFTNAR